MSLKLTFEPLSDVGRERTENQDDFGSEHLGELDFFIVCDGMGGHRGGSTASRLAVAEIKAALAAETAGTIPERLVDALVGANELIYTRARKDPELHGMGTTAVVLAVDHKTGTAHYAHVGDSRLYLVRDDTIRQLTRDHTFVQRLVDDGILSREAAESHPQSNVIIRSLGGQQNVEVEVGDTPLELRDGDLFVLCSDGLHGLVEEHEIADVATGNPLAEAARILVDLANDRGGHDNITVELVQLGTRSRPAPQSWTLLRPTPAPGTRLAKQAAAAAEAEADAETIGHEHHHPAEDLASPNAGDEPAESDSRAADDSTAPLSMPVSTPPNRTGAIVVVAVLTVIVLAVVALYVFVVDASPERTGAREFPTAVSPER